MGHGGFNIESEEGFIYFQDAAGNSKAVTGRMLGEYLKSFPDLRLVFLNACKTGRLPRLHGRDPFSATATALVKAGIPAVLAMQASISDDAAINFSSTFYERIAAGDPVDAAVVEGRLNILQDQYFDWANPVLFTRVSDGDILRMSE
jgi:CHAT domain-containing protein